MTLRHPRPTATDQTISLMLLGLLTLGVLYGAFHIVLPPHDQELLALVIWGTNPYPTAALGLGFLGLGLGLWVANGRRLRFVTPEHRQAARERREEWRALPLALRRRLVAPPGVAFAWVAVPYFVLWGTGFLQFSWGGALDPGLPTPDWVRTLADTLRGPGNFMTLAGPLLGWGALVGSAWGYLADPWRRLLLGTPRPRRWRLPSPGRYQMVCRRTNGRTTWHWRKNPVFVLGARETPGARTLEPHCVMRSWVFYTGKPIFGGMMVFGEKGSGKTSLLLRIILDTLQFRPEDAQHKPALMALDPKGDLSAPIEQAARQMGRSKDVVRLSVGGPIKWNPIGHLGPTSTTRTLRQAGYFLSCALQPAGGESASYWDGNAKHLLSYAITLLAWAGKTVSFTELAKLTVRLHSPTEADEEYRNDLYDRARDLLKTQGADPGRVYDLDQAIEYFDKEFVRIPEKPRGIIVNTVNNFLRLFEGHEYHQSFCGNPRTDKGHFKGFEALVDKGGIFVLDIRSGEDGQIQPPLCCLAKLFFQTAVKTRDRRNGDYDKKNARVVVQVLDEYQQYVTVRRDGGDDDPSFFETSRSFRCIDVVATQQPSSITAQAGNHEEAQRVVGSFNSLVFFRFTDPRGHQLIQTMLGQREVVETTSSVQEGGDHAQRLPGGEEGVDKQSVNRAVQSRKARKPLVTPEDVASLQTFEALGIFSEPEGRKAIRFCSKPHFVGLRTSQIRVLERIRQGEDDDDEPETPVPPPASATSGSTATASQTPEETSG